jgi:hypothetical protein
MKKFLSVVLVLCAVFAMSGRSDADVKVTFVNKTDRKVSVATMVYVSAVTTKGWYNIDPGKSRTISWKGRDYPARQMSNCLGYYAKASKKGAKTVSWRGDWMTGPIHPTQAFDYQEGNGERDDNYPRDAPEVGFRQIIKNWKFNGNDGSVTVTLTM